MIQRWTIAYGIAALWFLASSVAAAPPEIEYAYPDQSVWTTRLDARGEPDNPLLRVAAVLFARAELPWHSKGYPASRMFEYLRDGKSQFSMLVKAPSLQDCCLWSREPIARTELRVYRSADQAPIQRMEDLAGKNVIVIRGYSYAGVAGFLKDPKNNVALTVAVTHGGAFAMLDRDRADYVLDYAGPASEVLAAQPIADIAYDTLSRLDVHLVLSKTYPDAPRVMATLESIAATLDTAAIMQGAGR